MKTTTKASIKKVTGSVGIKTAKPILLGCPANQHQIIKNTIKTDNIITSF